MIYQCTFGEETWLVYLQELDYKIDEDGVLSHREFEISTKKINLFIILVKTSRGTFVCIPEKAFSF